LLAHGRWFSLGTPSSSTTKTGRHDIAEILLKVALKTKNQSINHPLMLNLWILFVGGCLTETIMMHRTMNRRLSQWTAISYLKQILEGLVYLQKKYVIHEDLKCKKTVYFIDTRKIQRFSVKINAIII